MGTLFINNLVLDSLFAPGDPIYLTLASTLEYREAPVIEKRPPIVKPTTTRKIRFSDE